MAVLKKIKTLLLNVWQNDSAIISLLNQQGYRVQSNDLRLASYMELS